MIKWARVGILVALVLGTVIWLTILSHSSVRLKGLSTGIVDVGTIETTVGAMGSVKPGVEEIVISPISSRIIKAYKRAGDLVEEGEPIVQLDLSSVETQYKQMLDEGQMKEYQLDQLRINTESSLRDQEMHIKVKEMSVNRLAMELRNERYLDSIGSGTHDNVRSAQYAWETAVLELEQMRQNLEDSRAVKSADLRVRELDMEIFRRKLAEAERTMKDARILAPRRAVLTQINSDIGSQIAAGSQVAVLSELDHYKLDCEIADRFADRVSVGSNVSIKIGREVIDGIIADFSPVSRSGMISFTVQPVDDAHPLLRSGVKADVYVKTKVIDDAVRIPNGSFYSAGPGAYRLYVINSEGTEMERRDVVLGQSNYEYVEVVSGLAPGETIVTSDMTAYKDEKLLKIKK